MCGADRQLARPADDAKGRSSKTRALPRRRRIKAKPNAASASRNSGKGVRSGMSKRHRETGPGVDSELASANLAHKRFDLRCCAAGAFFSALSASSRAPCLSPCFSRAIAKCRWKVGFCG